MIRSCLIAISILFSISGSAQSVSWKSADKWKMYYHSSLKNMQFQPDSVRFYESRSLDVDSMKYYLAAVSVIPAERSSGAVWMGDYWVSCQLNEQTKYLRVSRYGGFFEDIEKELYYEIPMELRTTWHLFLTHQLLALQQAHSN